MITSQTVNQEHQRWDQKSAQLVNLQVITREMCTLGWVNETRSQTVTSLIFCKNKPVSRRPTPVTFLLGLLCLTDRKRRHPSTRAVPCAFARQPQPLLCAHPPRCVCQKHLRPQQKTQRQGQRAVPRAISNLSWEGRVCEISRPWRFH